VGLALLCLFSVTFSTPLDDYVHAYDPTYNWTLHSTIEGDFYTAYVVELISQTWMTPQQSDSSVWRHWLTICVPDYIDPTKAPHANIYIDGGGTHASAPTDVDLLTEFLCMTTQAISCALTQIPNEPVVFKHDGVRRSEDAFIAYTWSHFLNNTKEPIWLARLPMTKAVVRAMDAVQEFVAKELPDLTPVKDFVVAGASKRGWTTWTTGAVDKRVLAMVPMVMPILNIVPNMNHHYQAYGGWSFALDDYLKLGLMAYLNSEQFVEMAAIVDPWSYRQRLTMPKLILCAAGDEFFLPDSAQFFMNGLPDEKYLNIIPDAEHSLATAYIDVGTSIATFFNLVATKTRRPQYSYKLTYSNTTASIEVWTKDTPSYVTVYYAYTMSTTLRDFRLVKCGQLNSTCIQPIVWLPRILQPFSDGYYKVDMDAPEFGWLGFLVELEYQFGFDVWTSTTEVNIVPNRMPFPPCGNHCQT